MSGGRLVVLDRQGRAGKVFPLADGSVALGRATECDIRILQQAVSPHHATVAVHHNQTVISNVSDGETLVNGRAVSVAALRHNDVITIGGRQLRWEYDDPHVKRPLQPEPALYCKRAPSRAPRRVTSATSSAPALPRTLGVHRASMPGNAGGKQVAIVQPQRRDTSEHIESAVRMSTSGPSGRQSRVESPLSESERRATRLSPNDVYHNATKASMWIESRKASPRKSTAPSPRKSAVTSSPAPRKSPITPTLALRKSTLTPRRSPVTPNPRKSLTPAPRKATVTPSSGRPRRAASAQKPTPLRLAVLRKAQSAKKINVTKIQEPLKIDHMKQAALMLMTGHSPKPRLSGGATPSNRPSLVVKKTRPSGRRSTGKGGRRSGGKSISVLEITDSEAQDSISQSISSNRSRVSPLGSPLLPSPKKSALKDPSAKKSSRKNESIKFDLSNLENYHDDDTDVVLVTDTTKASRKDSMSSRYDSVTDEDLTLHYSDTSSEISPSPRRSIHSRSSRMLEQVGSPLKKRPIEQKAMTPESPRARKSIRGSLMLQKALDESNMTSNSRRTTKTLTDQSWDTTAESAFKTRTLSPRSTNLESYSIVDLVSMESNDTQSASIYDSVGSTRSSSIMFGTPQTSAGRKTRSTVDSNFLTSSTPYAGKGRPSTRSNSSPNISLRKPSPNKSGRKSARRSQSLTTPENSEETQKHISINSTRITRPSRSRSRINDSDLQFTDLEGDGDDSPKTSRRGSKISKSLIQTSPSPKADRSREQKTPSPRGSSSVASSPRAKSARISSPKSNSSVLSSSRTKSLRTSSPKANSSTASSPRSTSLRTSSPKVNTTTSRASSSKTLSPRANTSKTSSPRAKLMRKSSPKVNTARTSSARASSSSARASASKTSSPRASSLNTSSARASSSRNTSARASSSNTSSTRASLSRNSSARASSSKTSSPSPRANTSKASSLGSPSSKKSSPRNRGSRSNLTLIMTPNQGIVTPENRHSPQEVGTPVLNIQNLLDSSQSSFASQRSKKTRGSTNLKRKTIGVLRTGPKGRSSLKSKSFTAAVRKSLRTLELSKDSDSLNQSIHEDNVTPKSAVKLVQEAVKNKHSTAKKPLSKRSIIDNLNESDIVKQLFNSPVKRKLSQSMTEFSRKKLFDDDEMPKRPTRNTIALSVRTPDTSISELSQGFTPEDFVSPLSTPSHSPNLTGIKRLFTTNSPRNDLRNVKGVKGLLRTPRVRKSVRNDLRNVSGVKAVFAKSPKNRLSDVRVKKVFTKSPRNDLRRVSGVKSLFQTQQKTKTPDLRDVRGVKNMFTRKSAANDLSNVSGVKKVLQTRSPRNDLTDVRGVKRMFGQEKQPDYLNVSGVEELFNESNPRNSEVLFDQLFGKPKIKSVYSKSFATKRTPAQKQRSAKSLHTSIDLITNNVEEWLEQELNKHLHKDKQNKSKANITNVSRELSKLATDTVAGSEPVRTSRIRSSTITQSLETSGKKSASQVYSLHMLPIKKRSFVEASLEKSASVSRGNISKNKSNKLPIKKRAVVHSTPVKGRYNVTMNASELGRVSPIGFDATHHIDKLALTIRSTQPAKSSPKPKSPAKNKETTILEISVQVSPKAKGKRSTKAKSDVPTPKVSPKGKRTTRGKVDKEPATNARVSRARKGNQDNQERLSVASPKAKGRGKAAKVAESPKPKANTAKDNVVEQKTRRTRNNTEKQEVEVKSPKPKRGGKANVSVAKKAVEKASPKKTRATRAAPQSPVKAARTVRQKAETTELANTKKRRKSLVISKKAPVLSPKPEKVETPKNSRKRKVVLLSVEKPKSPKRTRANLVVSKPSPKMNPRSRSKTDTDSDKSKKESPKKAVATRRGRAALNVTEKEQKSTKSNTSKPSPPKRGRKTDRAEEPPIKKGRSTSKVASPSPKKTRTRQNVLEKSKTETVEPRRGRKRKSSGEIVVPAKVSKIEGTKGRSRSVVEPETKDRQRATKEANNKKEVTKKGKEVSPKKGKEVPPKKGKAVTPKKGKAVTPKKVKEVAKKAKEVTPKKGKAATPKKVKEVAKKAKEVTPKKGKAATPKKQAANKKETSVISTRRAKKDEQNNNKVQEKKGAKQPAKKAQVTPAKKTTRGKKEVAASPAASGRGRKNTKVVSSPVKTIKSTRSRRR